MDSLMAALEGIEARRQVNDIWCEGYDAAKSEVRKIITSGTLSEVIDRLQDWLDAD